MPTPIPFDKSVVEGPEDHVHDMESDFHLIIEHLSHKIKDMSTSAYHQPLLTLLVGMGLALHGVRGFVLVLQVDMEARLPSIVRNSPSPDLRNSPRYRVCV